MNRRRALLGLGTASLAALGGCLSAAGGDRPATSLRCEGGGTGATTGLTESPLSLTADQEPLRRDPGDGTVDAVSFVLSVGEGGGTVETRDLAAGITDSRTGTIRSEDERGDPVHLSPGETHRWSLSLVPHPTPNVDDTTFLVEDLEPGRYWFGVRLTYEPADGGAETDCVAKRAFRVVA